MAVEEIRTFLDIQDGVMRRGKIEDNSDNRTKLKEFINSRYQKEARDKPYRWAGDTMPLRLRAKYATGTITTTINSDVVTGAATVWSENNHRFSKMQIAGTSAPFKIIAVLSSTSITLDHNYTATGAAGVSYYIYKDEYGLFPDCQEVRQVRIAGLTTRLQPQKLGPSKFDYLRDRTPFRTGTPLFYTIYGNAIYTEKTWSTWNLGSDFFEDSLNIRPRNLSIAFWPAIVTTDTYVQVRYGRTPYPMDLDSDEPWIPYEERMILVWGTLVEHFMTNRDPQTVAMWTRSYDDLKKRMAADIEATDDELVLYVNRDRYRRGREDWIDPDRLSEV